MPFKGPDLPTTGNIPKFEGIINATRQGIAAIRGKGHRRDTTYMSQLHKDFRLGVLGVGCYCQEEQG